MVAIRSDIYGRRQKIEDKCGGKQWQHEVISKKSGDYNDNKSEMHGGRKGFALAGDAPLAGRSQR